MLKWIKTSKALEDLIADGESVEVPGVVARFEEIGPERALRMLETMDANRSVSQRHVDKLKSDMPGRWKITGQGITFDKDSRLIDGQHRLWAIIESGETIVTLVVYGAEETAMPAIDGGRARSFGDDLKIEGETSYAALAAVVKLIWSAETAMAKQTSINTTRLTQLSRFEQKELLQEYRRGGDIDYAVKQAHRFAHKPLKVPHSSAGAAYFMLASRYGDEVVSPFFEQLHRDDGLTRGMPVKAIRDRFVLEASEEQKPSAAWYLEAILRAFVKQARGGTLSRYQTPANSGKLTPLPRNF